MYIAIVTMKNGSNSFKEFNTLAEAQAWGSAQLINQAWGLPQRSKLGALCTQEEIDSALSNYTDETGTLYYILPADFVISYEDVTLKKEIQALERTFSKRLGFGQVAIAKLFTINKRKNITAAQFEALMLDPELAIIERCLLNGSLEAAYAKISTLTNPYFSQDDKNEVLAIIAKGLA